MSPKRKNGRRPGLAWLRGSPRRSPAWAALPSAMRPPAGPPGRATGVGLPGRNDLAPAHQGRRGWCVMNGRHRSATAAHSTRTNCRPGIAAKRTAISRLGVPDATATPHGVNHLAGAPARVMTPARVTRLLPQRGASRGTGSPATARGMCPANPGMAGIRLGNPGLPARVGSISHRMRRGPICRRTRAMGRRPDGGPERPLAVRRGIRAPLIPTIRCRGCATAAPSRTTGTTPAPKSESVSGRFQTGQIRSDPVRPNFRGDLRIGPGGFRAARRRPSSRSPW